MTPEEMKQWIDSASYKKLLTKWRYAPGGDPLFQGEMGMYYQKVMLSKKPSNHTEISKEIGWKGG